MQKELLLRIFVTSIIRYIFLIMNTRQVVISGIGGIVTLAVVFLLANMPDKSAEDSKKPAPQKVLRKVNSTIVTYSKVESSVQSEGRVVSQQYIDIIAEVQGKILTGDIPLKKGQDFRKGDVLAKLYSKDAGYALQAHKSAYLNLLANILPDLKIDFKDDYPAWVDFFEKIKTDEDIAELPAVNSSQLKIFLASRNILSEYYSIKSEEILLDKYTIKAPYTGAIQNVLLEVGSVANPGSRIAQIIKTSQLEVEIPIESSLASWLRIGDRAILKTETDELAGEAYIKRISSFVDTETQSINVYLEVTKQTKKLYPGEYLRAEFSGLSIDNAMEIPRNAVFNQNMVFTVEDGFLSKSEINIIKLNEKTVYFNGIPEGAEIVSEPLANANESMQVQTDFTKPPQSDTLKMETEVGE